MSTVASRITRQLRAPSYRGRRRGPGFTPFAPPARPPTGSFDPAIGAQRRASERGFGYLQDDVNLESARGSDDFLRSAGDLQRDTGEATANLHRSSGRGLTDLLKANVRADEDYAHRIGNLDRTFRIRARTQTEGARQRGVAAGGALAAALSQRTANQAEEKGSLDTQHGRVKADLTTQEGRLREDLSTDLQRLGGNAERRGGLLSLGHGRDIADRSIRLERGSTERDQFGLDLDETAMRQALQGGYNPMALQPRNEVQREGRGTYQLVRGGPALGAGRRGVLYRMYQSGRLRRR